MNSHDKQENIHRGGGYTPFDTFRVTPTLKLAVHGEIFVSETMKCFTVSSCAHSWNVSWNGVSCNKNFSFIKWIRTLFNFMFHAPDWLSGVCGARNFECSNRMRQLVKLFNRRVSAVYVTLKFLLHEFFVSKTKISFRRSFMKFLFLRGRLA